MRIYDNCYELMSELMREVWEMGVIVHPKSMQDKDVSNNLDFRTKEITNYSYCLKKRGREEFLFTFDRRSEYWVREEFIERINSDVEILNPGDAWKIRQDIWEEFIQSNGQFAYSYHDRIDPNHQLVVIVAELKRNPDTRQAILSIWDKKLDPFRIGGKQRVPCSIYYQFLLRNGELDIIYNQRSADLVTHFGNDVWLAYELMLYVAKAIDVTPGSLYHNIGSLHVYAKDWEILRKGISDI